MVSFVDKVANFFVRDPRQQQGQSNYFYNQNYSNPYSYSRTPYNPAVYDPYRNTVGVGRDPGYRPSYVTGNYYNGVNNYTSPTVNIPGLSSGRSLLSRAADTAGLLTSRNPIKNAIAATAIGAAALNRLSSNNLPMGADYSTLYQGTDQSAYGIDPGEDMRVIVSDPSGKLIQGSITGPLQQTGGVLFPYTPNITFSHKAQYEMESLVHTNYSQPYYKNSDVDVSMQAKFTAGNDMEAAYVMAVIHFFRSATKMFYGQDSIAGTPPPVLRLDGYGNNVMDHLPVIVTGFDYTFPEDVDYIAMSSSNETADMGPSYQYYSSSDPTRDSLIPTQIQVSLTFKLAYSRNRLSNVFGLEQFASGDLITGTRRGTPGGPGGFI